MAKDAQDRDVARDLMLAGASVKKNSNNPAKVKRSADPRNKYWKAIQKNVMGNGCSESSKPESVATLFRFISTRAATAMAIIERTKPIPIRWRWVIPISDFVAFRANGMMRWS